MTLGLLAGDLTWRVGSPDLLHAFFSTIAVRLEPGGWGSRFPALMNELYDGELGPDRVETALSELMLARRELALLPADRMVWDAEAPHVPSPRGAAGAACAAADASKCFRTEDGKDLFDVLLAALVRLRTTAGSLRIVDGVAA